MEADEHVTADVDAVPAAPKRAGLVPDPAHHYEPEPNDAVGLVGGQPRRRFRGHGHRPAAQHRRHRHRVLGVLEDGRERLRRGDGQAAVGDVGGEVVVEGGGAPAGVADYQSELHAGGERGDRGRGGGGVGEVVDGGGDDGEAGGGGPVHEVEDEGGEAGEEEEQEEGEEQDAAAARGTIALFAHLSVPRRGDGGGGGAAAGGRTSERVTSESEKWRI